MSWNDDKGYGLIAPLSGGNQIFIRVSTDRATNEVPGEPVKALF